MKNKYIFPHQIKEENSYRDQFRLRRLDCPLWMSEDRIPPPSSFPTMQMNSYISFYLILVFSFHHFLLFRFSSLVCLFFFFFILLLYYIIRFLFLLFVLYMNNKTGAPPPVSSIFIVQHSPQSN